MPKLFLIRRHSILAPKLGAVPCFAVALLGWNVLSARAQGPPPARHPIDVSDIHRLAAEQPHAHELLQQAEALLVQGDAKTASELFEQAANEAPHSALTARRHCQTLTEIGQREPAISACRRAMQREGSPLDMRALIRAILSGPKRPTFDELFETTLLASRAQRAMPRQPWGYAATCDIARRLSDTAMLDACRQALRRVAPDHAETRRALGSVATTPSAIGITAGWAFIVLAVATTLFDWFRRALRSTRAAHVDSQPRLEP